MQCPFCKETIIDGAAVCRFCGKDQPGERKRKRGKGLTILFVIAAIIGGIAFLTRNSEENIAIANCQHAVQATGYAAGVSESDCVRIVKDAEKK